MEKCNSSTAASFSMTIFLLFFIFWNTPALASGDDTIRHRIIDQVIDSAILGSTKVTIYVEDGFVLLTGTVHRYLHKMEVERIAWTTTGVTEVENEIGVKSLFPLSDTAIRKKIRRILMDCDCFHGGSHLVQVTAGAVSVTGVFFHTRDVQFLKRKIAEIEGVVAIKIRATALLARDMESQL